MLLGLLCTALTVPAQETSPDGRVEISDATISHADGMIKLTMRLDATNVKSSEAITLTPVMMRDNHRHELPPVVFAGRHRVKADRRAERFGTRELPYDPAEVHDPGAITYTWNAVYEPWMSGAFISVVENVYLCAAGLYSTDTIIPDFGAVEPVMPEGRPLVIFVIPAAEEVKSRQESGKAYINFPVNRSNILPDFGNNVYELGKIRNMINGLQDDGNVEIGSMELCGYASPEGSYSLNQRLSHERVESLHKYLLEHYSNLDGLISVTSVAEDWNGLRELVKDSNLAGRDWRSSGGSGFGWCCRPHWHG